MLEGNFCHRMLFLVYQELHSSCRNLIILFCRHSTLDHISTKVQQGKTDGEEVKRIWDWLLWSRHVYESYTGNKHTLYLSSRCVPGPWSRSTQVLFSRSKETIYFVKAEKGFIQIQLWRDGRVSPPHRHFTVCKILGARTGVGRGPSEVRVRPCWFHPC